jgi:hypothetical protein
VVLLSFFGRSELGRSKFVIARIEFLHIRWTFKFDKKEDGSRLPDYGAVAVALQIDAPDESYSLVLQGRAMLMVAIYVFDLAGQYKHEWPGRVRP